MNKLSITCLIFIITIISIGCNGSGNNQQKNSLTADFLHAGQKYSTDTKESSVAWKGSMLVGTNSHTGYVYISKGELMIDKGRLTAGTATIDMNTIVDENRESDNGLIRHLKDPDFFDVKKFPISTFTITGVESINKENKKVTGNLTIKGITHSVTFPAKIEVRDGIAKMSGTLAIDRTKWDIRYKSGKFFDLLADDTMSDAIEFHIKIVAKKQPLNP